VALELSLPLASVQVPDAFSRLLKLELNEVLRVLFVVLLTSSIVLLTMTVASSMSSAVVSIAAFVELVDLEGPTIKNELFARIESIMTNSTSGSSALAGRMSSSVSFFSLALGPGSRCSP